MRGKAQSTLAKPNSALLQKLPAKTHLLQAGIICLSIHRLEDVLARIVPLNYSPESLIMFCPWYEAQVMYLFETVLFAGPD